ncbi:MAG: cytochrome c biogenesis protein CcdA [Elusimicrobiota bacterium]
MQPVNLETISLMTFLAVYVSGLLTSLTPCVYPILPIVVGYLGSREGGAASRLLSGLSYILGMALVYSALGMAAALTGSLFGEISTNTYVYLAFGVLMLFMGGSMMDWYYIPMPNLPGLASAEIKRSPFIGPFVMGLTSGLVASPCTAPVLASLLMYVAAKRAVVTGALLLFTFSMGLSTMLLVIGFFAGTLLPKSGAWMVKVKKGLAILIIGAGIYFIYAAGKLA